MMSRTCLTAACICFCLSNTVAAADMVAATPPMGWNSWDCYGTTVTEAEVKANAAYMAKHLKQHGWQYVVVDIQWSDAQARSHGYRPDAALAMDRYGRLIPAPNRFPSSVEGRGFKPLADYVHGLGLLFGIHIRRGIPRRAVKDNLPVFGSKVRAADIARPAHRGEIAALHAAIQKTGRPIVLSLSPGPAMVKDPAFFQENANMWRISDDFWDDWKALRLNFILMSIWSGMARPGAWPDADMLPLGRIGIRAERGDNRMTRFTRNEQRTVMSLWSIAQSPLMFGGDLPGNDAFTLSLLTNDEVLAVDQHAAHGAASAEAGDSIVWTADAAGTDAKFIAVFNVGDREPVAIPVNWAALHMPETCVLRDLWDGTDFGAVHLGYTFHVPPHGSGLYKLTPVK